MFFEIQKMTSFGSAGVFVIMEIIDLFHIKLMKPHVYREYVYNFKLMARLGWLVCNVSDRTLV